MTKEKGGQTTEAQEASPGAAGITPETSPGAAQEASSDAASITQESSPGAAGITPETSSDAAQEASPDAAGITPETSPDISDSNEKKGISVADKLKFAGLIAFIILMVGVGILILPYFPQLTSKAGQFELVNMILDAGVWGILVCLGLQFLQVVVAFIPGEVTQIAIGAVYGPLLGTLVTAIGALIPTIFIYFVVHRLGTPFVHAMISKKHEDKLRFLKESRRLDTIVFVLFLIPGLPKDVFTYLISLTGMRALNFFVLSTLGRIPGIVASAYIGNAALQGNYTGAIIVAVIAGALGLLGIIFNGKIMAFIEKIEKRLRRS